MTDFVPADPKHF